MQRNLIYEAARRFIQAYARLMLRLDIHKHADLPAGPALFAANHPSATDPFLIHLLGRMSVLITANAFAFPIFGAILRGGGQIAVEPGGDALEQAAGLLRSGRSVGIFPEGTFSPQTGGFGQPRSGAARLALATGVPVVPVGIHLPRERSLRIASTLTGRQTVGYWYLHGPYALTVGQPLRFSGDPEDRGRVTAATQTIMERIQSLARESEYRMSARPPAT